MPPKKRQNALQLWKLFKVCLKFHMIEYKILLI